MFQFILLVTFLLTSSVFGQRDKELYCAVCRVLVDEVNWNIKQVDPKKKVQVGSFRVDPNGNQQTYEIPFGRSEIHLTDVFETICEEFKNYAQSKDGSGRQSVIRTSTRDGVPIHMGDTSFGTDVHKKLKFICETIVEEHEEDMIPLFKDEQSDLESNICLNKLELCTKVLLEEPLPKLNVVFADEKNDDINNEDDSKDSDTNHGEL